MNYQELIETICNAAFAKRKILKKYYKKNNKADKTKCIIKFQRKICRYLKVNYKNYTWGIEIKPSGGEEKDSIDIKGTPPPKKKYLPCIIEIDACREDQVAAKFLSRLALWGLDKPIIYVALLYYNSRKSKNMVKKYIRFATKIMEKINEKSIVVGLYYDVNNASNEVEVWDYNKKGHYFKTTFKITDKKGTHIRNTMIDCASKAIELYIQNNSKKTYDDIKAIFGKFINNNEAGSRYKKTTTDKIDIYSYTQFRRFGKQANWPDFVRICNKRRIKIEEIVPTVPKREPLH